VTELEEIDRIKRSFREKHNFEVSMTDVPAQFRLNPESAPDPEAVVQVASWRFTLLTSRLIRIEYDARQIFEDRPSQVFWHRKGPVPSYQKTLQDGLLTINTDYLQLSCQSALPPEQSGLEIQVPATGAIWHLGDQNPRNLSGTYRTLDRADGPVALEPGLVSRSGWAVVDDTHSLLFNEQGWLEPRPNGGEGLDLYFFGYGSDYPACLYDYTKITGRTPLIPRWALGNWWSRYWDYSQDELTGLMREFRQRSLPLSVCIVDMDWHITSTGNSSTGWTGYTWNNDLFPDPQKFLDDLHQLGLHVALNLHPAEGIHPHEADYPEMAHQMGIDPASAQPVPFDLADPHFAKAYFEILHHPQEARGVDFWWLDWQQGTLTELPGLDPLSWLNHLHALDMARDGKKRPFIFSRWGGLGNHRYPIGFSGDTHVTWKTLAFQPYFTAAAANVAYGWWSHDIGGHMCGIEDAELYVRWVQFGVLSPIFRLHSTKNPFHERLPWKYDAETERLARFAMRFRYALIPYLYSMAWREHLTGAALVQPMYYAAPDREECYHAHNQYLLGSQLIAAPFTSPRDQHTRMARQVVWLPEGRWYSFPGGRLFTGGRWHAVYGGLEDTPLFARAGAILPLGSDSDWSNWQAPDHLQVHVFPGASNHFDLYEDDGETTAYLNGSYAVTPIDLDWKSASLEFRIGPGQGDRANITKRRKFDIYFYNLAEEIEISASIDGAEITLPVVREGTRLKIFGVEIAHHETFVINIRAKNGELSQPGDSRLPVIREMLRTFHLQTLAKTALSAMSEQLLAHPDWLGQVRVSLSDSQFQALTEVLCGFGFTRITEDGGDRILLWNPDQHPGCTYQFSAEQLVHGVPDHYAFEGGQVPVFKVFDLTQPSYQVPWRFQVQYLNQLQMIIQEDHTAPVP
jgi:alpha-glucosidase (family GH31 glycosyl hydrolase)